MRQTKTRNSRLGSSECYDSPKVYFKDTGTHSSKEAYKEWSNDLVISIEEVIKVFDSSVTPTSEKDYDSLPNFETSKEILDLSTQYSVQFSIISCQFEKWSAQRRMLIKKIESLTKSLNQTKSYCAKGRMIFSAIDISGTLGSSILENLNVSWSPKLLLASAAFGCLSLVCSLIELSQTKSFIEKAVKEIKKDKESLRDLQIMFQRMKDFDRSVRGLFPHGVNASIVRMLQEHPDDRSPTCMKKLEELIKALPTSTINKRIWMSVILTNAIEDIGILDDEDFLSKADKFSKSRVAEIWWKRMKCKEFPVASKTELEAKLKSCLKVDLMPLHAAPLLSTPLWYTNGLHTIGSVFVNSLVVYDSYSALSGHQRTREVDILRQWNHVLQKEYDDVMNLYETLSPHYDE